MRRWANSWDTAPPKFPCWSDGPTVGALGSSPHIVKPSQVTALSVPWPLVVSVLGVVRAVLDDQYVLTSTYFAVRGGLFLSNDAGMLKLLKERAKESVSIRILLGAPSPRP